MRPPPRAPSSGGWPAHFTSTAPPWPALVQSACCPPCAVTHPTPACAPCLHPHTDSDYQPDSEQRQRGRKSPNPRRKPQQEQQQRQQVVEQEHQWQWQQLEQQQQQRGEEAVDLVGDEAVQAGAEAPLPPTQEVGGGACAQDDPMEMEVAEVLSPPGLAHSAGAALPSVWTSSWPQAEPSGERGGVAASPGWLPQLLAVEGVGGGQAGWQGAEPMDLGPGAALLGIESGQGACPPPARRRHDAAAALARPPGCSKEEAAGAGTHAHPAHARTRTPRSRGTPPTLSLLPFTLCGAAGDALMGVELAQVCMVKAHERRGSRHYELDVELYYSEVGGLLP